MGFDQGVMDDLNETLGPWDDAAVPGSLLEILPAEVLFPLRDHERSTPYDHRLHLLVRELTSRLGETGRCHDEVIKHCGDLLAVLYHDDDEAAAGRLFLEQMTLLADEYYRLKPWDILGSCWRGELACWAGDEDLALEYAQRVWDQARSGSSGTVHRVTTFFALTGSSAPDWNRWKWDRLPSPSSHLGELNGAWIDRHQPLAWALVRRAFQQGTWDTSLLCSMMALRDNGFYCPKPDDAPAPCWSWLAEHGKKTWISSETYYAYWNHAFQSLTTATDPALAHNVTVATLGGRLFNKDQNNISASIPQILQSLYDLHRRHPMPEKERAVLEFVSYVSREKKPKHLAAADRLAIDTAMVRLKNLSHLAVSCGSTEPNTSESDLDRFYPLVLHNAELNLKSLLGEALWARLSQTAKREFKHGEFHYIIACSQEGEGGDFNSVVMSFSRGLLAEIHESLKGPLTRRHTPRGEFRDQFGPIGGNENPEWGDILRYMDNFQANANPSLVTELLSQGVQLNRLDELRKPFEDMRKLRNDAAHTMRRIDRERAAVLHDLLMNKGLIRNVIKFFPKPPRR